MKSEENIFLLSNEKNYYEIIKQSKEDIIVSYYNTINFYVSYSIENMNIKDKEIYYAGFSVIKNVFRLIFLYTKNLELTIYNCQQAVYYYVEYISQITDREDNIFFNLSIKDAVIYVYTRTIFEIKKKNIKINAKDYSDIFSTLEIVSNNYSIIINNISSFLFNMSNEEIKPELSSIIDICNKIPMNDNRIFLDFNIQTYNDAIEYLKTKCK